MRKLLALCALAPLCAQNLIATGNFESGHAGWTFWDDSSDPSTGTINWQDPAAAYSGTYGVSVNVSTAANQSNNWRIQLQSPTSWSVESNTVYQFSFWAKGAGNIHVGVGDKDYNYLSGSTFTLNSDWKQYTTTLESGDNSLLRINFYLAEQTGDYFFDDVVLTKVGILDTTWYQGANTRIQNLRKSTFNLTLQKGGVTLANQTLSLNLKQHDFPFGTAMAFYENSDDTWYKQTMAEYFWAGVMENDFKWPSYEPSQGTVNKDKINSYLDWADAQGWKLMRGHALEWGVMNWGWDTFWARTGDCSTYKTALKTRIERDLDAYKGKFQHYDVWNEVFHETALFDKCGADLLDSAFIWARTADPSAKLYLNEYGVVASGQTQQYVDIIQGFVDRNIPFDGIGVQCHYNEGIFDPAVFKMRIDALAKFGKPILITEFDIGKWSFEGGGSNDQTELEQAQEMSAFIRSAFSHEAIEGIYLWGFWDTRHWVGGGSNGGGIFREDQTAKPAADSIKTLWRNEWTTQSSGTTNAQGSYTFSGFKGTYTLTIGGQSYLINLDGSNQNLNINLDNEPTTTNLIIAPSSLQFHIQKSTLILSAKKSTTYTLFDTQGKSLYKGFIEKDSSKNLSLTPGYYILKESGTSFQIAIP